MNSAQIFAEGVAEQIGQYLPPELKQIRYRARMAHRTNGVPCPALELYAPGDIPYPVVYLDRYYAMMQAGYPVSDTMEKISSEVERIHRTGVLSGQVPAWDYSWAKEHLSVMLVNTRMNRQLLARVPHMQVDDLSVICRIDLPEPDLGQNGKLSLDVTEKACAQWGIRQPELFADAVTNMQEKNPPYMAGIDDVYLRLMSRKKMPGKNLLEGSEDDIREVREGPPGKLYILTTQDNQNGAAAALYPGVIEKASTMFPKDFYILPASIHELLLVRGEEGMIAKELEEIVKSVNRDVCHADEVLSDHVYRYERDTGKLKHIPGIESRGRGECR